MSMEYNNEVLSALDTAMTREEPEEQEERRAPDERDDFDMQEHDREEAADRECERRFG